MNIQNLSVKFFLQKNELPVASSLFHPIFNRWIQEGGIPSIKRGGSEGDGVCDILIDVADYSHLHHGPVMVLVGHHANYSIDNTGGRLGFLYSRKSFADASAEEKISDAFLEALHGCKKLEDDPALSGRLKFKGEEAELFINNRLLSPNNEETFRQFCQHLNPVLKRLYQESQVSLGRDSDPRKRLTIAIRSAQPVTISELFTRLQKIPTLLGN